MPKPRSQAARREPLAPEELDKKIGEVNVVLMNPDRAYGEPVVTKDAEPEPEVKVDEMTTITISLKSSDAWKLKDLSAANKRSKTGEKSVTALILKALRDQGVL